MSAVHHQMSFSWISKPSLWVLGGKEQVAGGGVEGALGLPVEPEV
jgi:hypothetical protein